MGLVGNGWANCFRTHNELTMVLKFSVLANHVVDHVIVGIFVSSI